MPAPPDLQHLNAKVYLEDAGDLPLEEFIPVFHSWIQKSRLDDLLIDVADYRHVPSGPGVLLIGHNAFYSIDFARGEAGVLYNRRTASEDPASRQIAQAVERALEVCRLLSREPSLEGRIRPDTGRLCLMVNDRLLARNDQESLDRFQPLAAQALESLFGPQEYRFQLVPDPRRRLTVEAILPRGFPF